MFKNYSENNSPILFLHIILFVFLIFRQKVVEMSVDEPAPGRKYRVMRPDVLILPSIRFVLYQDVFIMCSLNSRDL